MRKKIRTDLAGITVEGKPLTKFLEDQESTEARDEFNNCTKRPPPKTRIKEKMPDETKRVRRRVKRWTNQEIRKEYGIMSKSFKTMAQNILWLIINKGPISAAEIEAEMGKKKNHLSGPICKLYEKVGDRSANPIITRAKQAGVGKYKYSVFNKDISTEDAFQQYEDIGKRSKTSEPHTEPISIKKAIEGAISDHLGINVVVSGKVEIVFKLG